MLELALDPRIQDTITIFLAIFIEAVPFVLLGVIFSQVVGSLVGREFLIKLIPKNFILGHVVSALLGLLFPVCECGNVPLTKRLVEKGFGVSHAVSFYLGSPILNPVVIASTASAFGAGSTVLLGRLAGGLAIATIVGIIISQLPPHLLKLKQQDHSDGHSHHDHADSCDLPGASFSARLKNLFTPHKINDMLLEFTDMTKYLLLGAGIAAFTQLWLPRDVITQLSSNALIAILAMMLLALIISVCSTVDAFVALAYANKFSPAALLGFLIYGPMIDIKAITMLHSVFKPRLVWSVVGLVTVLTLSFALLMSGMGF